MAGNVEAPYRSSSPVTQADWDQWSANWIWRAVQCLVELPEFNPSPKWISARLNVTVEKAVEAIEGLERLGCIAKSGSTYIVQVQDWFQITPQEFTPNRVLTVYSRLAPQLISKLQTTDAYTSQFFVGDRELIKKYSPKFMKLFKEMNDEAKQSNCKDVIAAQISFVQLTDTEEEGAL